MPIVNVVKTPSVGSTVYLYYDGKGGREVTGKVVKVRGFALQVTFNLWTSPHEEVTMWFVRSKKYPMWSGFYREGEFSLVRDLLDSSVPGDFYSLLPESVRKERLANVK